MSSHNIHDIFTRVDSTLPLAQVLKDTAKAFALGEIQKATPIVTGYQDCNIDLETSKGKFVVKIFASDKTKQRVTDVVTGYVKSKKAGIPVPALVEATDGSFLLETPGATHTSTICVFSYFEGKPLTKTPVTDEDLIALTKMTAVMHGMQKPITRYYDTMGIANIATEYKKKSEALSPDEQAKITPIVNKVTRLNLSTFPQSIIHGTLEKENVLKNSAGELCLLDLGCMDYNASVLDIATMLANFTLYISDEKRKHISQLIIDTYQQSRTLTPLELTALPALIRAQYAAYIIAMTYHMRKEHDMTKQTQTWLDRGWDGIKAYASVRKLF